MPFAVNVNPNLSIHLETNWCVAFAIHLPAKKLSEDRSFQEALQMAIVDEIATKETLQMQQKQTLQPVNEVTVGPNHPIDVALEARNE